MNISAEAILLMFVLFMAGILLGYWSRRKETETLEPVALPKPEPPPPPPFPADLPENWVEVPAPLPPGPNSYIFRRRLLAEFVDNPGVREPWAIYELMEKGSHLKLHYLFSTDAANVEALLDWIENR